MKRSKTHVINEIGRELEETILESLNVKNSEDRGDKGKDIRSNISLLFNSRN
ncbi:12653_t:CDS:2 [Funneliformis caledonium]|uniref:12653_t:CDS:1 n=1 Tax=Funneliformis caledonium TaxID=1117310 RepID=A0A9N8VCL6_9GLOM|nr:12653_t:CDS:2 [Funneliformis caledonium]